MYCTCGPHPHIDLTSAYSKYHQLRNGGIVDGDGVGNRQEDTPLLSSCRQQIQSACQSHGCFHVTIHLSYDNENDEGDSNNNTASSPLLVNCLAKNSKQIEEDIESLFSPSFLQRVIIHEPTTISNADAQQNEEDSNNDISNNHVYENICNGGLVEVNNINGTCTFRGRVAESGDEEQATPEPKLSWEYRRCCIMVNNNNNNNDVASQTISSSGFATVQSTTEKDTSCDTINSTNEGANNTKHQNDDDPSNLLPKWTKALHSVASTIIHLLDIPSQVALQEDPCKCSLSLNNNNAADTDTNKTENLAVSSCQSKKCNIDLLRVFRYDAISSSTQDNDNNNGRSTGNNDDEQSTILGSSPHSDWGTVTVVYQDTKGGLQTYCHACDKWSDVKVVSDVSTTTKKDDSSRTCSLFVHVGDFLSLASITNEVPKWPSPRHRVLCPTINNEERTNISHHQSSTSSSSVKNKADYCRRSLVYFAYPPPNVTLEDVQRVVSKPPVAVASTPSSSSFDQSTMNDFEKDDKSCVEFYNHYSLLHNQSQHQQSFAEKNEVVGEGSCSRSNKEENYTTTAMQTYHQIRNISFDKVISDKWSQVQRL